MKHKQNSLIMHMWKNNIKLDLAVNEWHGVEWIQLVQDTD
jgi:hypothetical protein